MRFVVRPVLCVLLPLVAACSGGGSSPAPGPTAKPAGAASKAALAIHIPAPSASPASNAAAARTGTARAGRARPALISPSSNGLSVVVETAGANPTQVDSQNFDISSSSPNCTPDGSGGRACSVTVTEAAGTYAFVISTYANVPGTGGFTGQTSLDSGVVPSVTLTPGATTTVAVTLGGTVASVQLVVPPSFGAYGASTITVGVTALDALGETIISSAPYSNGISLNVKSSLGTSGVGLAIGNGTPAATVTSTLSSDVVTIAYPGGNPAATGDVLTVTASLPGATSPAATATTAPLYVTAANPNVVAAGTVLTLPVSATSDVVTVTRAGASNAGFLIFPTRFGCSTNASSTASASEPLLFTYNGTTSTVPPTQVTATNGSASLTVSTAGYPTPAGGCFYEITDGTTTVALRIVASAGSYTPCPGTHLYVNDDNTGLISYALPLTNSSTGTQLESQDQTTWLSFDPSCNAYISEYEYSFSPAGVLQFANPYGNANLTSSYTGASGTLVYGAAVDGAGHLFLDETNANQVVELSSFSNSATVLATLPVSSPYSIAFDSAANLYVGGSNGISVFAYPYSSTTPTQTILSGVDVQGVAFDASSDLFAVGGNTLYELKPPYTTIAAQNTQGLSSPLGLAVDPATGDVYVPNYGNNTITGYAPPYTGAPFATVSGSLPDADAIGP